MINGKAVGLGYPTYFIADIAANHDGDLNRAKDLIHLAAECGADAAKFQNFKAATIVSDHGFRALGAQVGHQKTWEKSVYDVYTDASIPDIWSATLKDECDRAGIHYATSPYDFASVDNAEHYTAFYKIGSGDISWLDICRRMAVKGKPMMLATGASAMADVANAVEVVLNLNPNLVLMQCNSNYTGRRANFCYLNLNVLLTYAKCWPDLVLGLSDHTPGHSAVLGAVALNARVIEKHFTDDNFRIGPDHSFSLTPHQWTEMVQRTRELEDALGDGIKRVELNESETAILQRRALRAVRDMPAGYILKNEDIFPLRPAPLGSLPPSAGECLLGRTLKRPVTSGESITENDIMH
jgi:N-acetylneuraminate synthase